LVWSSFSFQAEDGIREFHVTGVQTCALPIFIARITIIRRLVTTRIQKAITAPKWERLQQRKILSLTFIHILPSIKAGSDFGFSEIGRAACRKECRLR